MRINAGVLAIAILILAFTLAAAGDMPVDQAQLTAGTVYEINRDASGKLYITDWGAGEIWRVDAASSAYARYGGLGAPNDAHPDGAGNIWFTDYYNPQLRRINTNASPVTVTTWDLSAWDPARTFSLGGLAIDSKGWVWLTEQGENDTQLLYRFKPESKQLCGYTLPGGDHSFYVLNYSGYLWLGDWVQNRIVRFSPSDLQYTYWDATAVGEPRGLAVDGSGFIWWADKGSGKLVRLEPSGANANQFTTYTLPVTGTPYMVAVQGGKLWYTAEGVETSTVGNLDPGAAGHKTSSKNPVTGSSSAASFCDDSLG